MRTVLAVVILIIGSALSSHAQWTLQNSGTTASLRGIHSIGKGIAWASGTNGTVLRTVDDGLHWQTCATPVAADKLDFRGIHAFDGNTAIIMSSGTGALSRLYKTTNGCRSWKLLFTNPDPGGFWDAIRFNEAHPAKKCFGLVLGDPVANNFTLFVTLDCGETWERQKSLPEALPGDGAFAASNSSLILGGFADRAFVTGGTSGPRLLHFSTGVTFSAPQWMKPKPANRPPYQINTWHSMNLPQSRSSASSGAFSVAWAEGQGPVVVGGDYQNPDQHAQCAWYWNAAPGELGFRLAATQPRGFRSSVAYDTHTRTWIAVGPNGTDISTDNGRNWRPLTPSSKRGDIADADRNWNALSLPFVVGPNGRIGKLRPDALKP